MPTILVVDDSDVDRKLVRGLLEHQTGWSVTSCGNGREAIEMLTAPLPDLIVTDLQMPEMDGLELVREVKEEWPFIPVVLLTARGSEEIAVEALRGGAASYVTKRRLTHDLIDTSRRILAAVEADRAGQRLHHYLYSSKQSYKLRNHLEQISLLALYVQQQLRCLPLGDETERLRVCLAFEEALKNACLHGNLQIENPVTLTRPQLLQSIQQRGGEEPYAHRRIHVDVVVDRNRAQFIVRDEGGGFDHSRMLKSAVLDDQERASSRGLALMRTVFDELTFNDLGNEVTLVKQCIESKHVLDDDDGEED